MQTEFCTGFIPELLTVCRHLWRGDAVEDDDTIGGKNGEHLRHDIFQMPAMSANEYGIRTGQGSDVGLEEVANMNADAWGSESAGILVDDGLALRTDLEGFDMQVGELQTGLDGYTTSTESDIPEHMPLGKVKRLQRQQADGHLRNHLLPAVEQRKRCIGNAERMADD